jgi:hypothetical protein
MARMTPREFAGISLGKPHEVVRFGMLDDGTLVGRIGGVPITGHQVDPMADIDEVRCELQLAAIRERQNNLDWDQSLTWLREKADSMNSDLS